MRQKAEVAFVLVSKLVWPDDSLIVNHAIDWFYQ
jgi:hypothetical protein